MEEILAKLSVETLLDAVSIVDKRISRSSFKVLRRLALDLVPRSFNLTALPKVF